MATFPICFNCRASRIQGSIYKMWVDTFRLPLYYPNNLKMNECWQKLPNELVEMIIVENVFDDKYIENLPMLACDIDDNGLFKCPHMKQYNSWMTVSPAIHRLLFRRFLQNRTWRFSSTNSWNMLLDNWSKFASDSPRWVHKIQFNVDVERWSRQRMIFLPTLRGPLTSLKHVTIVLGHGTSCARVDTFRACGCIPMIYTTSYGLNRVLPYVIRNLLRGDWSNLETLAVRGVFIPAITSLAERRLQNLPITAAMLEELPNLPLGPAFYSVFQSQPETIAPTAGNSAGPGSRPNLPVRLSGGEQAILASGYHELP